MTPIFLILSALVFPVLLSWELHKRNWSFNLTMAVCIIIEMELALAGVAQIVTTFPVDMYGEPIKVVSVYVDSRELDKPTQKVVY